MFRSTVNVSEVFFFESWDIKCFENILDPKAENCIALLDINFARSQKGREIKQLFKNTEVIDTHHEPTTIQVDQIFHNLKANFGLDTGSTLIAFGGGAVLDIGKAVSNLCGNDGNAADYQGWDLLAARGCRKIGVPTLFGTGAESSRTCVMLNPVTNVKLGMNSDFSVFDKLILSPELCESVPKQQKFYTAMDSFIHSFESLDGSYRSPLADYLSTAVMSTIENVFASKDWETSANYTRLATASYLGGVSINSSYVGLVHPISAALSGLYGLPHCLSNCIAMHAVDDFYPVYSQKFSKMTLATQIRIPYLSELADQQPDAEQFMRLVLGHQRPLLNALGTDYEKILNENRFKEIISKLWSG